MLLGNRLPERLLLLWRFPTIRLNTAALKQILSFSIIFSEAQRVFYRLRDVFSCRLLVIVSHWIGIRRTSSKLRLILVLSINILDERISSKHRKNRMLKLVRKVEVFRGWRLVIIWKSSSLPTVRTFTLFQTGATLFARRSQLMSLLILWGYRALPFLRAVSFNNNIFFVLHSNVLILFLPSTFERRNRLRRPLVMLVTATLKPSRVRNINGRNRLQLIKYLNLFGPTFTLFFHQFISLLILPIDIVLKLLLFVRLQSIRVLVHVAPEVVINVVNYYFARKFHVLFEFPHRMLVAVESRGSVLEVLLEDHLRMDYLEEAVHKVV